VKLLGGFHMIQLRLLPAFQGMLSQEPSSRLWTQLNSHRLVKNRSCPDTFNGPWKRHGPPWKLNASFGSRCAGPVFQKDIPVHRLIALASRLKRVLVVPWQHSTSGCAVWKCPARLFFGM
jgi:hypothetical protein